jgi:predicted nucleic acid-binding protein
MIVLDTNVVSELMRPRPDPAVARWLSALGGEPLTTTAITVAEIIYGLQLLPAGKRRKDLEDGFAGLVGDLTGVLSVLPLDETAAREAGRFRAARQAKGLASQPSDMMIAGIAAGAGAGLATRNIRDFSDLPLTVIDPWAF